MSNEYIDKLINCIHDTRISVGEDTKDMLLYGENCNVDLLVDEFIECKKRNGTVYFVGNGGSAAIASHMTADFLKNGGIKTGSLYNNAVTTCISNDFDYEYVFSKQLEAIVNENDLLVSISSSGNSKSIINAISVCKDRSVGVITFSGFSPDNISRGMGRLNVWVPSREYGIVESIHNLILQQIVDECVAMR